MELDSKSPIKLPHNPLANKDSNLLPTLLSVVCDAVFAEKELLEMLPMEAFLSSLKPLKELVSGFRLRLLGGNINKKLTEKEQFIIQDAMDGLYEEGDIEDTFCKHRGLNGIIALLLYFRTSDIFWRHWNPIHKEFRRWLIKHAAKMLPEEIVEWWIQEFDQTKGTFLALLTTSCANEVARKMHQIYYLGQHARRKQKRQTLGSKDISVASQALPPHSQSSSRSAIPQQYQ
jgi:hypothetical protein